MQREEQLLRLTFTVELICLKFHAAVIVPILNVINEPSTIAVSLGRGLLYSVTSKGKQFTGATLKWMVSLKNSQIS